MSGSAVPAVNFKRLIYRLAERACDVLKVSRVFVADRVIDGLGKSAEDFSMDTLCLYLEDELPPFSGDEEALFHFLAKVMTNDILDALRSSSKKTTRKVEPLSGCTDDNDKTLPGLDDFEVPLSTADFVDGELLKERLYALLKEPEPELYELVVAILEFGALKPQEIAETIGTTTSDVQNRKKRLRTFLSTHSVTPALTRKSL
jgi:DNA-directed RNA polymerase specialized sigma24 family protein